MCCGESVTKFVDESFEGATLDPSEGVILADAVKIRSAECRGAIFKAGEEDRDVPANGCTGWGLIPNGTERGHDVIDFRVGGRAGGGHDGTVGICSRVAVRVEMNEGEGDAGVPGIDARGVVDDGLDVGGGDVGAVEMQGAEG